jgi:hypothetical protein
MSLSLFLSWKKIYKHGLCPFLYFSHGKGYINMGYVPFFISESEKDI